MGAPYLTVCLQALALQVLCCRIPLLFVKCTGFILTDVATSFYQLVIVLTPLEMFRVKSAIIRAMIIKFLNVNTVCGMPESPSHIGHCLMDLYLGEL